jgi:hypothetical protein
MDLASQRKMGSRISELQKLVETLGAIVKRLDKKQCTCGEEASKLKAVSNG